MDRLLTLQTSTHEDLMSTLEQIDALIYTAMEINFTEMTKTHAFNYFATISDLVSRAKKMSYSFVST